MKISQEVKERAEKLKEIVDEHRYKYHTLDNPTITDGTYDSLMEELRVLEEQFPELKTADSPTQRIGGKTLDKFEKVQHKKRQWSLSDAFSLDEMKEWEDRTKKFLQKEKISQEISYVTEVKIDGLKIVLDYKDGIFIRGATRGDGLIGEDATENIKTIGSVPLRLSKPLTMTVVGECWLSESELERLNKERKKKGEAPFANSRNAAAGSIRQLNPQVAAKRKLNSYIYDINVLEETSEVKFPKTQIEELELLKELGFKVNPHFKSFKTIIEIEKEYELWTKKRNNQEYGIDGLVIKVSAKELQDILGYTGKSPRHAIAWKFPTEKTTTIVESIIVQVGRTGALTPVANLRPVLIAGSTVSRATLHNEDEIVKKDVRIGDTIVIHKAGDIIPEVVEVLKKMRTGKEIEFRMPKKCPICGGDVEREVVLDKKKNQSAAHYCKNPKCFAVEKENVTHFVSRKGFGIDGLGDKIVEQLIGEGLIRDAADIFTLKVGDLIALERFAEKSAQNLVVAAEASKSIALEKFLYALGIRHFGEEGAILVKKYALNPNFKFSIFNFGLEKLETPLDLATYFSFLKVENLMEMNGVGEKMAKSLVKWFGDEKNQDFLQRLFDSKISFIQEKKSQESNNLFLNDKSVVLTGSMKKLTREEAKDLIRTAGGKISSSISKKTDFLIVGKDPGSKFEKAQKFGTKILTEEEFLKEIEKSN